MCTHSPKIRKSGLLNQSNGQMLCNESVEMVLPVCERPKWNGNEIETVRITQHRNIFTVKRESMMLKLVLLMLFLSGARGAWAQVGGLTHTGDMTVCLNAIESYGVMPTAGSTYIWSIIPIAGGNGSINNGPAPNNLITIVWTTSGTCTLAVTERNSNGCDAVINSITITVQALPIVPNAVTTVCSGSPTGVALATTSTNGLTITSWDITAVVPAGLTGTATTGTGLARLQQ